MTFPWGSIVLFGIDKVTKYHMEMPLYTTTFALRVQQGEIRRDVGQAEEGDRQPLHQPNGRPRSPAPGPSSSITASPRSRPRPARTSTPSAPAQVAEWRKAAAPLEAKWADGAKKAGVDPAKAIAELRADLKKENAAY